MVNLISDSVSINSLPTAQNAALEPFQTSQRGVCQDVSTLLSLREHVNSDSSSFCSCFTQFINWFKSIFSNFFASKTARESETAVITEGVSVPPSEIHTDLVAPPPSEIQRINSHFSTYLIERITEEMNQMIDHQFSEESQVGIVYPVDVIVVAKYNEEVFSVPFQRLRHHEMSRFVESVKERLSDDIREIDEDLVPSILEVKTCYIVRRTPDLSSPSCRITSVSREFDFRDGAVRADRRITETNYPQSIAQFLHDLDDSDQYRYGPMASFLFPAGVTDPRVGYTLRLETL